MAHCYTDLPARKGERNLAIQLSGIKDSRLHLWFGLDFIPGVKDNDILLWHEIAGVFIIEVKAVKIDEIEYFGWEKYKISGRSEDSSPQRQANNAKYSLINFLTPLLPDKRPPYTCGTVCWPKITRAEWNNTWDDKRVVGEFSERMVFREDIESGQESLLERLQYIWEKPPAKEGFRPYKHNPTILENVKKCIEVRGYKKPAPSDLEKLNIIEDKISRETLEEVPPSAGKRVFYYGYPGTGKTFRLLQIGVAHALSGCNVLFSCFNKVLAADIRRVLALSRKLPISRGQILVQDIFAIASDYAKIPGNTSDYDEWGRSVYNEMKQISDDLPKYETVLIDEAQDMKDWALGILGLLTSPNASVCIAAGGGQELYGQSSEWLKNFETTAKRRRLNRNFRNTAPVGRLAHVFFQAALDENKITATIEKFTTSEGKNPQSIMFERPEGQLPSLINITENINDISDDGSINLTHFEVIVSEYKRIIEDQIARLSERERPLDLLFLVPRYKSIERRCAVEALQQLGINFIDYSEEDFRRHIAQPDTVRLCTFHSSRGIEGRRVIIFGYDLLEEIATDTNTSINNLGYVTLSRSIFESAIVVRPTTNSKVIKFVEAALRQLRSFNNKGRT